MRIEIWMDIGTGLEDRGQWTQDRGQQTARRIDGKDDNVGK